MRRLAPPHRTRIVSFLLAVVASTAQADFRCGNTLVELGHREFEVRERCGAPDYDVAFPVRSPTGQALPGEVLHWYYNPGPHQFIYRLVLHNAVLVQVQQLGRGFSAPGHRHCSPGMLRRGLSEYELLIRCGKPIASRLLWRGYPLQGGDYLGPGGFYLPAKEWVFEFGSGQFRRAIILENGEVSGIEVLDKPR